MSKQLDLVDACARRNDGMARAQAHAESDRPGWTEAAARYLYWYANRTHGQPFLIEDAAALCPVPPANGKSWGPAVQLAVRCGWIVKAGYAPARTSNLSPKCLWRAAA